MRFPVIDAQDLRRALPMTAAIDALEVAFRGPLPEAPLRTQVQTPSGSLLFMPSASADALGVKLVTLTDLVVARAAVERIAS